jgi:hypothetical protein
VPVYITHMGAKITACYIIHPRVLYYPLLNVDNQLVTFFLNKKLLVKLRDFWIRLTGSGEKGIDLRKTLSRVTRHASRVFMA